MCHSVQHTTARQVERKRQTLAGWGQWFITIVLLAALLAGCQASNPTPVPTLPAASVQGREIRLPQPRTEGPSSLEEALSERRSIRAYADRPLSLEDIAQLFWAAQGVTRSWGGRTAPSAGALYPLEIYAATAEGVYHYLPAGHRAEVALQEDIREELWAAGLEQESLRQAPAIFVITAVYERTARKYGTRAERYVKIEAGHAAQNLLLQAVALDLAAVPIGAFYDEDVAAALHLTAEEEPLYLIPVGHPAS
jgi:SagB-type dehydrogenase family enzyme